MPESTPRPPIEALALLAKKLEKVKPSAANVQFYWNAFGPSLKRLLGSEAKAVREFEALNASYKSHGDPERLRNEALAFINLVLHQLQTEVPFGYRPGSAHPRVFLGHGRSALWIRVEKFIQDDLGFEVQAFETESRASQHIVDILAGLLANSDLAILVLTAEDLTSTGEARARQNVVHEVGLFQGRLGFNRVFLLEQGGIEEPSNLAGLQTIRFGNRVEDAFYDLQRALARFR